MTADDRRPIGSRDLTISKKVSTALVRAGVSANGISVFSMVAGTGAGLALAATGTGPEWHTALWLSGAALIFLRLLANMFDGMVALESGTSSPVGELYNEIPDRVSDSAVLIGAGYAAGGWVLMGFAAATAAMFTAYVRAVGKGAGARSDFSGPMAKQQRMFLVIVSALWCAFTPGSYQAVNLGSTEFGIPALALTIITVLSIFTALRRTARIARQLRSGA